MATFKVHIFGDRNYGSQDVEIEGVNSGQAALDACRARYPGCNVKTAQRVDPWTVSNR